MKKLKKVAKVQADKCVACGSCIKVCPREAINVFKGIRADVKEDLCIGCGLCAKVCPASVIEISDREGEIYEK